MSAGAALVGLVESIAASLADVAGLRSAQVWDGAWSALDDPGRLSIQTPAALVSVQSFRVVGLPARRWASGRLVDPARAAPSHTGPLDPARLPAPGPHVRAIVGVAIVSALPAAPARSAEALRLAEAAAPVLLAHALTDVEATNLYTRALMERGLATVALVGRRDVELAPDAGVGREPPSSVRALGDDAEPGIRVVWPESN